MCIIRWMIRQSAAGAGMVMKPEVWSERPDELLGFSRPVRLPPAPSGAPVLVFPNPSAPLFTQRDATELSHADHLLFGCGRYEGYDARIPDYYRAQGVDVREYSNRRLCAERRRSSGIGDA